MKITMYELLGMVKDGKELPKKVKVLDVIYEFDDHYGDYFNKSLNRFLFVYMASEEEWKIAFFLNTQVEILEEEKKIPEKLETYKENNEIFLENFCYKNLPIHKDSLSLNEQVIVDKLNEVLDYLNSKGDE